MKQNKNGIRLQKAIAQAGITSRRKAEELIKAGRVSVNGRVATIGTKADPMRDSISVDGELISEPEERITIRLHKPTGYITALSDDRGRATVMDLITDIRERIFPVGRLDYNSEGVLLLTNDGDLAHRLAHPSQQILRTYHVKVRGNPNAEQFKRLTEGILLEDGMAKAVSAERIRITPEGGHLWFELVLTEGKNREVRRMCEAIGHPVTRLIRSRFGPVNVDDLRPGEYKVLSKNELKTLRSYLLSEQNTK
jgi:pseudouridine synthase